MFAYHTTVKREGNFLRLSNYLVGDSAKRFSLNHNDEKLEDNLIRARSTARGIMLCNEWDYFVTLTLSPSKVEDRFDFRSCLSSWCKWLNNFKSRYAPEFKYILIPEFHKSGAIHAHALMKGIPDGELSINQNGWLDWKRYSEAFGFCSLSAINSSEGASFYMLKYIAKSIGSDIPLGCHSFYASKGLKRPETLYKDVCFDTYNALPLFLPEIAVNSFSSKDKHFDCLTINLSKLSEEDIAVLRSIVPFDF